jgi:hypothetical protein
MKNIDKSKIDKLDKHELLETKVNSLWRRGFAASESISFIK